MLRVDMTLASILSTILFMMYLIVKRPMCCALLYTGKVDKNVLQHTRPAEKTTVKGVKRRITDGHILHTIWTRL